MIKRQIYLQKERFTVSGNMNIEVEFELSEDNIVIFNERGGTDFIFKNGNTKHVLEYWREVLKCMDLAVVFAQKRLDKSRILPVVSITRKGAVNSKTQAVKGRKTKSKTR